MNLHEYQAKTLFARYGMPVSERVVARTEDEAAVALKTLGASACVVKVQAHAGGRGKAGGVKVVSDAAGLRAFARKWLGARLVTAQTGDAGQPVSCLLAEPVADIAQELYLGAVVDRSAGRVAIMASTEGGVEIETVAARAPEKILREEIDPWVGAQPFQGRRMGFALGLSPEQVRQFTGLFLAMARMFVERDLSLVEVNPLAIGADGRLHCLDAKVGIDGNALFRQGELAEMRDPSQEDEREVEATTWGLNYVALSGNIGCMVNGAGLAMGTMDIIQLNGGAPANFLDVGGGATGEAVSEAFKLILSDRNVRSVLVNIFGGIVRCDLIAEGIIAAVGEIGVSVPVVVRLEGNRAEEGLRKLADSALEINAANELSDAARTAIRLAENAAR